MAITQLLALACLTVNVDDGRSKGHSKHSQSFASMSAS